MSSFNPQEKITRVFILLRQKGFKLGVKELLSALKAVGGGFGEDEAALRETLQIMWCHSPSQQSLFNAIWESLIDTSTPDQPKPIPPKQRNSEINQEPVVNETENSPPPLTKPVVDEVKSEPEISSLPVRAPFNMVEVDDTSTLQTYYPITRRSLVYNWRYLRRLVADGSSNKIDINATIEEVSRQGFYLNSVYRKQEINDAHLLLLLDQNGSMTPFHRFERDLVETALYESSLDQEKVDVFYFHNVPAVSVYQDIYLTEPIPLETVLANCDNETSILIVSDAGAARGYRELKRIRATSSFLFKLKRYTSLIAWLNPMPEERWIGSSAEIIANLIPMYEMNNHGLNNAIDIVRGQV